MIIENILYDVIADCYIHFIKNCCFINSSDKHRFIFYVQTIQFKIQFFVICRIVLRFMPSKIQTKLFVHSGTTFVLC